MVPDALTFLGHTCLLITLDQQTFLVDPNFSQRVLWFWKRHSDLDHSFPLNNLSAVLITNPARPQLDIFSLKYIPLKTPLMVHPQLEPVIKPLIKYPFIKMPDSHQHRFGSVVVKALASAQCGVRGGSWRHYPCSSFLLKGTKKSIYVNTGSRYGEPFAEIGKKESIDVACLPLGTSQPRWLMGRHNMSPQEALNACADLKAKIMVPIRWGTFRRGLEGPQHAIKKLRRLADGSACKECVRIVEPGNTLNISNPAS